jgi:hypothetical protein
MGFIRAGWATFPSAKSGPAGMDPEGALLR